MGSSLKKKSTGTTEKVGIVASVVGGGLLWYALAWFIGLPVILIGGGYFFFKLMKVYAETGRRF